MRLCRALSDVLAQQPQDTLLLVPDSVARRLPPLAAGRLHVLELPHVIQADFDALLWRSTLNIVRGEDSLVRAIWAGAPMIWQPYLQQDKPIWISWMHGWTPPLCRVPYAPCTMPGASQIARVPPRCWQRNCKPLR